MNRTTNRLLKILGATVLILSNFFSVYASPANASSNLDYYVSPQGNDANNCTYSAPCKTFDRAASFTQVGDSVHLLQGTYNQQLTISQSGIHVIGEGAVIDGSSFSQTCVPITGDNIVLDSITVKNCQTHGITVFGSNVTVQNSTVTNSILENYPPGSKNSGWGSAFKSAQGSSNVTFLNNLAYENFGEGFGITKTIGATLHGNVAIDNYSVNFYPDNSSDVVLTENLSACSGNPLFSRNGSRPNGIALGEEEYAGWTTHPRNILITNNVISGCGRGFSYWGSDVSGGGLVDVTIQNNTFYGNEKTFSIAYSDAMANVVIQNNIFEPAPLPWLESPSGITFRNNFWIGALPNGNMLGTGDVAGDPKFAVQTVWNDADSFRLSPDSPACGYGRWDCQGSLPGASPPVPTSIPPTVAPTSTATPTPTQPTIVETTYDDKGGNFIYSSGWKKVSTMKAYGGSYRESTKNGSSITFEFTGQSFSILYKGGTKYSRLNVYVDGILVGEIDQNLSTNTFQQRWDYPDQLPSGNHTLKLVLKTISSTVNRGSLDAIIVR